MATRRDIQQRFHEAALQAYRNHGFQSYRHAEQVTGVNYSTIYTIVSRGHVPTRGQVIEWAEGLGESINKWLALAGYDPIISIDEPLSRNPACLIEKGISLIYEARGGKSPEADAEARRVFEQLLKEESLEAINGEPDC